MQFVSMWVCLCATLSGQLLAASSLDVRVVLLPGSTDVLHFDHLLYEVGVM